MMAEGAGQPPQNACLAWLWGTRVQRIDAPEPTLFVLTLYGRRQKQCLLLALGSHGAAVGVTNERPQGLPASAFVRRLRGLLENGRLERILAWTAAEARASALELTFLRQESATRVIADFDPRHPNLLLLDADGRILGAADEAARHARFGNGPYQQPARALVPLPHDAEQALTAGAALLEGRAQDSDAGQRKQALTQAKAALKRAQRKRAAIAADVARAETAPGLRHEAEVLLCHLAAVPHGASEVTLEDFTGDPAAPLRISLDPSLSAQRNAEQKFARARRLSRGVTIATERLRAVEAELTALQELLIALEQEPLAALSERARAQGLALRPAVQTPPRRGAQAPVHVPYRLFEAHDGARILVGKGAADNDALTLHIARPRDLWLHARGVQGAHVIVPRSGQTSLPAETLVDAAHLAAHFSSVRGERVVEIQHTERRYVRKPKGSAPGSVQVERERTLLLRVEPDRLQRLLAREREAPRS